MAGESYRDKSTGPTGAKSFGPHSEAHSTGDVIQGPIKPASVGELAAALQQLLTLLEGVQVGDPGPINEAREDLKQSLNALQQPEPDTPTFSSRWEKVKGWLSGAISIGIFVAEKAEQVKGLIQKISGLIVG